jgi:transposase
MALSRSAPINNRVILDSVHHDVVVAIDADVVASLRAKFDAVLPHLDERQQRLVMAADARSLGHGGIAAVAGATGASRSRISQGVAELEAGVAPLGRVRRGGGGRKKVTATDPALVDALLALVEPTRRGDPESPLCWTTCSTRKLAAELTTAGHRVGPDTVARLLHEQGFSLQANAKTIEGGQHPDRDAQFSYLNDQAGEHLAAGDPVISVDTKKKELVGPYKNAGAEWRPARQPEPVKVWSRSTTSSTPPWARPTPTASTTWPPTPVGSASAPTTTPQRSPSKRSAAGGSPPPPRPIRTRPDC